MADLNQLLSIGMEGTEEIDKLLASHAKESLSVEEIRAQRISFVMGMLPHDTTMTREQVKEILDRFYGYGT